MRHRDVYQNRADEMARLARRAASRMERDVYQELAAAYARLAADAEELETRMRPANDDRRGAGGGVA
jgi:hypothetical protein